MNTERLADAYREAFARVDEQNRRNAERLAKSDNPTAARVAFLRQKALGR